jgi:glycosyltransferase involved in cell wall biosynthesis
MDVTFSIVSPVYDEAEGLAEFVQRTVAVMEKIGEPFEFILVNDGSRDRSLEVAAGIASSDPRIRVVSFSRNFGHEAASTAGLRYARGQAVVLIDSDLQDPPEVIAEMIAKWREGYQIIYGQRSKREQETALKKLTSWAFYRVFRVLTQIDIPQDTGDFRLLDRRVVQTFNALTERSRFVRAMIFWTGFKTIGVSFVRAPRFAGKTKYNYFRLIRLAIDSITSFSTVPLRMASWLGMFVVLFAMTWIVVAVVQYFYYNAHGEQYRPGGYTFMIITMLLMGGTQIFLLGLLGEYLARTYREVQGRPLYVVDQLVNFSDTPASAGPNGALLPSPPGRGPG